MKISKIKVLVVALLVMSMVILPARDIKWLAIGDLQNWFSSEGCEIEVGRTGATGDQIDGLRYPALYSKQDVQCQKSLWIGAANYADPISGLTYDHKVVNIGPRQVATGSAIMETEYKLIGKKERPAVFVDGSPANQLVYLEPSLDEVDPALPCDRMIYNKVNTSMGISFTRKVMAFSNNYHQAYHLYEFVFTNDGIYNAAGSNHGLTLTDVYFYWTARYAVNREATVYELGILPQAATWGRNTMNHAFGVNGDWGPGKTQDLNIQGTVKTLPTEFRGVFSWQGSTAKAATSHADDFGAPYAEGDKRLTSVQFPGVVVLHADTSPTDPTDDVTQPSAWQGIASDLKPQTNNKDQFDAGAMDARYSYMDGSEPAGYLEKSHAEYVIDANEVPFDNMPDWPGNTGGISAAFGFGPYTLAPGESIKIAYAEAVGSIGMEERRSAGIDYANGTINLAEKDAIVCQGVDMLFSSFQKAVNNYAGGIDVPFPPEAPESFNVIPGGDRITLNWARNSESSVGFAGYRIYRALGEYDSTYHLLLDVTTPADHAVDGTTCFYDDRSAVRGFDYYYYIEAYDDGAQNGDGKVLSSSKFYTLTSSPAQLKRLPGKSLEDIRIVPNPYNVRAKQLQFGTGGGQADRIMFYNIPPKCNIKIYTERGELIWEKDHTNNSGDEAWASITDFRQVIVSGVYITVITATEDYINEATGEVYFLDGEQVIKKFIVVR
jgi:hypothetical protein